jgi:hypothetical protein
MSESEKPLRQQMADAMAAIREQVDVLRAGPSIGEALDDSSAIADLEAEYAALKEARAAMGPADR